MPSSNLEGRSSSKAKELGRTRQNRRGNIKVHIREIEIEVGVTVGITSKLLFLCKRHHGW